MVDSDERIVWSDCNGCSRWQAESVGCNGYAVIADSREESGHGGRSGCRGESDCFDIPVCTGNSAFVAHDDLSENFDCVDDTDRSLWIDFDGQFGYLGYVTSADISGKTQWNEIVGCEGRSGLSGMVDHVEDNDSTVCNESDLEEGHDGYPYCTSERR